jgi:asparagine synthase (glutamine-hydrolysing)
MCGIAGVFSTNSSLVTVERLKRMTDAIIHRGPDGEGQWVNETTSVGLGHRRLSIIDLTDAGAQPMHFASGRYTITFNGEIYNYKELRAALQQEGHTFHTETDTEVLLTLFHLKREQCLYELDGMFAFAIWDEELQELFCARDRFGEKPFHYFWDGEQFVFASEIKALFAGGVPQRIAQPILQDFLNRYIIERGTETFFENVVKLQHAHYLIVKKGNLEIHRYFDIDLSLKTVLENDQAYADRFRELFVTSVKRRMRSDVPVGSSLSGGLDSSSIVCFMRRELGENALQKTFSARFDGPKDEGKWMHIVSDFAHTEHHEVYPDPKEILTDIEQMVYHHEYPFGSPSQCAWWYVMKMAKANGVVVLLDGQGADEYLSGYPIMKNFLLMQHLFRFNFGRFRKARRGYKQLYGEQYPLGKMLWAHPALMLVNHPKGVFYNARNFKQRLKYETMHRLQELLAYADRTSMAFSLEVRLPFLNHELVEYTMSLPDEQLYNNGMTKQVLRRAIHGIVPEAIENRIDKIGYEPPEDKWKQILIQPDEVVAQLKAKGYKPGPSAWRNYIATVFLKQYGNER